MGLLVRSQKTRWPNEISPDNLSCVTTTTSDFDFSLITSAKLRLEWYRVLCLRRLVHKQPKVRQTNIMILDSDVASLQLDLETISPAPECLRRQITHLGPDPAPQLQMVWKPQTWINWLHDLPHATQYLKDLENG